MFLHSLWIFRLIFLKNCTFFLCSIHCSFLHRSFVFVSYSTRVHGEVSNSPWASLQQILLVASIALSQFSAERSLEYRGGDNTLGTPLLVLKSENSALTDQTLMTNPLGTQQLKCKRDTQQSDTQMRRKCTETGLHLATFLSLSHWEIFFFPTIYLT